MFNKCIWHYFAVFRVGCETAIPISITTNAIIAFGCNSSLAKITPAITAIIGVMKFIRERNVAPADAIILQ